MAEDARHAVHRVTRIVSLAHEHRPDQIMRRQIVFTHQIRDQACRRGRRKRVVGKTAPGAGGEVNLSVERSWSPAPCALAVQSYRYITCRPNWFSLHVVAAAATLTGGATDMLRRAVRVGAVRGGKMQFALTEDQRAIRDMARDFARGNGAHAAAWDAEEIFPVDMLRRAAGLGMATIYVGAEHGGAGLGRKEAALIFEELSAGCVSTAAYLSIHNMVAWMIDRFGDDALRARFLPRLCSMEALASYCLTEPGSGSDAAALATRAVDDGHGHYVLNGGKAFISGGGVSDVYAVMARTGGEGAGGISCILVEKDTPGLSFGAKERKMGWNSQPTAQVMFTDCRVPKSNRVGEEGEGFKIAMQGLDGGRVNIAACSLGGARAAMEAAQTYMGERQQFGRKIENFQACNSNWRIWRRNWKRPV